MTVVYDDRFNQNEWFILISLLIGLAAVILCPRRFPRRESLAYFLFSVFVGMVFDKTISVEPFDFYDVNDSSDYELMDFLAFWMYGPFGYFYVYLYDYFKIRPAYSPAYILLWAAASVAMEYCAQSVGVFRYKNGYTIYYSFPIYLLVLSVQLYFYKMLAAAAARPPSRRRP